MKKKKSQKISGGQAAVLSLKKERTKHVFGLIGSATMEMFDALYKEKTINFIGVRDERTGTHMADGYARASNKPGIILAGQKWTWSHKPCNRYCPSCSSFLASCINSWLIFNKR